jgi:branched-chain amino acid transport system permease protein
MHGRCGLFHTSYRQEDALFPSRLQKTCLAAFLAALLCAPLLLGTYMVSVLNLILIAVIGAVALNLLTGVCGQISLGHGAFIGVGAYAAGLATTNGVPFLAAMLLAGGAAAVAGIIFGVPSLRLKGIYLAIATLAAQLILEYVFLHAEPLTGGASGLAVYPPEILGFSFDTDVKMFYLIFAVSAVVVLAASNIMRTRPGRAFVSIRDHHLSAEIVGVNLFAWKLRAFALSSFLAGVGGALWGHYTMYITPEQFGIGLSVSYLAMIIIGGLGSVLGSIMGAALITLLPEVLASVASLASGVFPDISTYVLALRDGVFGLVLVLFLIFEPEGLVHRWRLIKAYWKLYPFAY